MQGENLNKRDEWFIWYSPIAYSSTGERGTLPDKEYWHIIRSQEGSRLMRSKAGEYIWQASLKYVVLVGESTMERGWNCEIDIPMEFEAACMNQACEYSVGEHCSRRPWKNKNWKVRLVTSLVRGKSHSASKWWNSLQRSDGLEMCAWSITKGFWITTCLNRC